MKIWINADDFGWTESSSKAIIEAFKNHWLTTTTVCVNGLYFNEAISSIRNTYIENCIGIHFNLTEGIPITEEIKANPRFCKEGKFISFPSRLKELSKYDKIDIYRELTAQAECFKSTLLPCNHVDSHNHIHNAVHIFPIFMRVICEQGWDKLRLFRNYGKMSFLKKIAKYYYNSKIINKGYAYSDLFGSAQDYNECNNTSNVIFEIMVHPDFHNKTRILIDRDCMSKYESPFGQPLSNLIKRIESRQDKIIFL